MKKKVKKEEEEETIGSFRKGCVNELFKEGQVVQAHLFFFKANCPNMEGSLSCSLASQGHHRACPRRFAVI